MSEKKLEFTDACDSQLDLLTKPNNRSRCHMTTLAGFVVLILVATGAFGVCIISHFTGGNREMVHRPDPETLSEERSDCFRLASQGFKELCNKCPAPNISLRRLHRKRQAAPCLPLIDQSTNSTPTFNIQETPTVAPKLTNYRIPTSLYPTHYNIEIQTYIAGDNATNFFFKGNVKIWLRCDEPSDNVTLHLNGLAVDNASLNFYSEDLDHSSPNYTDWSADKKRQFFILNLDDYTKAGKTYVIEMNYTSPLRRDLNGFYLSLNKGKNKTTYQAVTQFQHSDARKAFPCFDEPAIKSTFNVTLVRPSDFTSISNMPLIDNSTTFEEDGVTYVKDVYAQTKKMSTYLVAFVVSDFSYIETTTKDGVLCRAWAREEVVSTTEYALNITVKALAFFEELFGVTFPLPKLDMVAVPDFGAGGMENWGLMTFREWVILFTKGVTTSNYQTITALYVSHEVAHQWFGDLVTPSWWDDLWLNEGFSYYIMYLGADHVHPEWNIFESFAKMVQEVLSDDGMVSSHPIYVPVGHTDEIDAIFDSISYQKGAAVVRMMKHFLGDKTFKKGMSLYLTRNQYSDASHDDLWAALTEQVILDNKTLDVKEVMDTWILQMNYPLVTVTRDLNSNATLRVQQERFLLNRDATDPGKYTSPFNYTWNIPLTFASSLTLNFDPTDEDVYWLWKDEKSKSISYGDLPPIDSDMSWFICNVNLIGFYRVNYDLNNWQALAKQLKTDHTVIPIVNRLQLINDVWNLFKSGYLELEIPFLIMGYLEHEKEQLPWTVANKEFGYIGQMLTLTPAFGSFQAFMQKLVKTRFQLNSLSEFNFTDPSTSESSQKISLIAGLACRYQVPECIDAIKSLYETWMDNPKNNSINPNIRSLVYCRAIDAGGFEEWNFAFQMYKETDDASEKNRLLSALSCTNEPWILNYYLNLLLEDDSPFRKQDSPNIVSSASNGPCGTFITWHFLREHFEQLKYLVADTFNWGNLILAVTGSFNTKTQLEELRSFKASHEGRFDSGETAIVQAIETAETNVKWMKRNYKRISAWLSAHTI